MDLDLVLVVAPVLLAVIGRVGVIVAQAAIGLFFCGGLNCQLALLLPSLLHLDHLACLVSEPVRVDRRRRNLHLNALHRLRRAPVLDNLGRPLVRMQHLRQLGRPLLTVAYVALIRRQRHLLHAHAKHALSEIGQSRWIPRLGILHFFARVDVQLLLFSVIRRRVLPPSDGARQYILLAERLVQLSPALLLLLHHHTLVQLLVPVGFAFVDERINQLVVHSHR